MLLEAHGEHSSAAVSDLCVYALIHFIGTECVIKGHSVAPTVANIGWPHGVLEDFGGASVPCLSYHHWGAPGVESQ